jgi:nucleoside triphosphate pyrophosphatase
MIKLPDIILASESPQRSRILEELGISYRLLASDADEIVGATPQETALTNAKRKIAAAISSVDHGTVILAADTVLTMQGQIFGKPKSKNEAKSFLQKFSGKSVEAVSGVAAMRKGDTTGFAAIETARIEFETLSKEIIEWYISTGEPLVRAGAFGISRLGEILVKSVKDSYSCVAGLPKRSTLAVLYQVVGRQNLDDLPAELFNGNLVVESFSLSQL